MIDIHKLRQSIERAASDAVQRHEATLQQAIRDAVAHSSNELRQAVISQVMAELEPELATPPGGAPTDLLNAAIASIQDASSQGDILGALLSGAEHFSARCGLLVVRADHAGGWQARGLDAEAFKHLSVDVRQGLAERAIRTRGPVAGSIGEFDGGFVNQFGAPADGNVILLPLVVRDRVAALLYADGGQEGSSGLDSSGVEVLVRATYLWLEVISARKAAEHGGVGMESGTFRPEIAAVAEAPAAVQHEAVAPHEPGVAFHHVEEAAADVAAAAAIAAAETQVYTEPELDEIHKKAKRFAKLLVDEIKLYNQAKVTEGRQHRDLYDRLREDIDKSRAAYNKRYADSVSDADYFTSELVRILADNDRGAMGGNFQGQ